MLLVIAHTVTVPNLPSREICRQTGENHIEQYTSKFRTWIGYVVYIGVYTCVEQKQ